MPKVIAREGEAFQVTLRKFKKSCEKAGLLSDIKKNNYYEKPSVERRRKNKEARRKALKLLRKQNRYNRSY
ncbi:MAG: 30S ribosomal protein S21 [Candidatus Cloacimonas sp. 4484_143]|nr:MAG: 30S ribosomal protein S21 [Candidatus Cloacimonas sp. 4484_143]RLC53063.1 MAG: 30S ribosomal protein S21 [Candidatus Cloacimonadota bacterium]